MNAMPMTAHVSTLRLPPWPSAVSVAKLFAGGLAGLLIWEIWARVFTKAVLGIAFMSFAGHVIYGAVAAYAFEKWASPQPSGM